MTKTTVKIDADYMWVDRTLPLWRTIQLDSNTLVDVTEDGRIVGVETVSYPVTEGLLKVLRAVRLGGS